MPDILLFGATGYTGRLTARALAERGASFAVAGRDRSRLEQLAREVGDPEVRVAHAGDVDALVDALDGVRVLLTCVGPFVDLGDTAVEAALRARVHYLDSTGEGPFIQRLFDERDEAAKDAGIAMGTAMAFDEVPADLAAARATEGLDDAELALTYAVPTMASPGTLASALGIITSPGPWIVNGRTMWVRMGERERWAPMPPPLGPRPTVSAPLAELYLAPRHIDLKGLRLYVTTGSAQRWALRFGLPVLRAGLAIPAVRGMVNSAIARWVRGPAEEQGARARFTILAEARTADAFRNVVVTGSDVYGLSAHLLAAGAMHMAQDGYAPRGVLAPMQAMEPDQWEKTLIDRGVSIEIHE